MESQETVRDVMRETISTLRDDDPLSRLVERFRVEKEEVFPVTDKESRLVGIVSITDLFRLFRPSHLSVKETGFFGLNIRKAFTAKTISDIMTPDVIVVRPETPLEEGIEIMREHHLNALPVVNKRGELIGILKKKDIIDRIIENMKI